MISPFGRRYLELMTKVDQLMPMLETLAIDEVIEVAQLDLQKGLAKKSVRQVAGAARWPPDYGRRSVGTSTSFSAATERSTLGSPETWPCAMHSTSPAPGRATPGPIRPAGCYLLKFACLNQAEAGRMEAAIKKLAATDKRILVGKTGAATRKSLFG